MQEFKRHIEEDLLFWKQKPDRKPLILRGARQVGKSTLVRKFSHFFDSYIELNLELERDALFFEKNKSVSELLDAILLSRRIQLEPNKTLLLFIDEIQERPLAIQLLRYFYEDLPHIYVITAGSLLEFALGEVKSFPVGRVEFLYLHPINFAEFLEAEGNTQLLESFQTVPVPPVAHDLLLERFHIYCILGGMPEVVKRYLQDHNFTRVKSVYNSIWSTYKADIEKYAANKSELQILRHILRVAPNYLDERITFQNFGNSNYRSREVGEAFRSLDAAGIIRLIYPTTDYQAPAIYDLKKAPRLQFLDTGIVNNALGIQGDLIQLSDFSNAYRGALIPHIITQEIISLETDTDEKPLFWVRDKAQSSAEIDLVYRHNSLLIPIEIKSGTTGSMKSLHQFINRVEHHWAIRVYGGKLSIEAHKTPEGKSFQLLNLPYYLGTRIHDYVAYFMK